MSELDDNARRTIAKCEEVLNRCEQYFAHQAEMNASGHMASKVLYPPIHSAIESALLGIETFKETYPQE